MKKTLFALLPLIALIFGTTSCNNNNEPSGQLYFEIATLVRASADQTIFDIPNNDNITSTRLTFTNIGIDTTLYKPGTRWIVGYTIDTEPSYGNITGTLYSLGYVYNGVLTEGTSQSTGAWKTQAQNVLSIWRSGKWLNFITQSTYVDYNSLPKTFSLVVDSETLDNAYPDVYLLYEASENIDATTSNFYSTFDIESVWDRPNVKGINLTYINFNGQQQLTLNKTDF